MKTEKLTIKHLEDINTDLVKVIGEMKAEMKRTAESLKEAEAYITKLLVNEHLSGKIIKAECTANQRLEMELQDARKKLCTIESSPLVVDKQRELMESIRSELNKINAEAASDTPDFILAQFLTTVLGAYNAATIRRDVWYGKADEHLVGTIYDASGEVP